MTALTSPITRHFETAKELASVPPPQDSIEVGTAQTSLGTALVAATKTGLRAVLLGSSRTPLLSDLRRRFPDAHLVSGDPRHQELCDRVGCFIDAPGTELDVQLDLAGTDFEKQVWMALCHIPLGTTSSYSRVAKTLGVPANAQTVAAACAANSLAVIVPCHRVVRKDGSLAGYRWGSKRKRQLLAKEFESLIRAGGDPLTRNGQRLLPLL